MFKKTFFGGGNRASASLDEDDEDDEDDDDEDDDDDDDDDALWSGTNKNREVSTGPLARPFARSLAPLTRSLAPDCSLRSRPPLCSLVRSLAHFAHSLARGKVIF